MTARWFARSAAPVFSVLTIAACSGGTPATPEAFVSASLRPGTNGAQCPNGTSTTQLKIGVATGGGKPTVVADGQTQTGTAVVNVQCTVTSGGTIHLNGVLGGNAGGAISIDGQVDANSGSNIHGSLASGSIGWSEGDCTISYTYSGGAVPVQSGEKPLAPGRIWAHLSCPKMSANNGQNVVVNGVTEPAQCDGEADFLFENCQQ
ncbi:MAG: hypothetical protein JOZ69_19000 [Myxococcales bacterium]|nr:hypothetical protein [Myxococcales bacterium]